MYKRFVNIVSFLTIKNYICLNVPKTSVLYVLASIKCTKSMFCTFKCYILIPTY